MGNEPNSSGHMDIALRFAVPMWLIQLKDRKIEHLQIRSQICAQAIGEKGDVLMYGSKKAGAAGEVFNRLAEGIACLCLISRHPIPFGKAVFHHTGRTRIFDSEQEANEYVWPKKVSFLSEENNGSLQPETV